MKLPVSIFLTSALLFLTVICQNQAGQPAVDPTGTWELRTLNTSKQAPSLLKLKLEGGKLTGTLSRNAGSKIEQLPLQDARIRGSEISFAVRVYALNYENNVLQPTDTNKVTHSLYQGEISGDTMKGKVEKKSWLEDNSRTSNYEAKRKK